MLKPPLALEFAGDVVGGWGSSFSRMALTDLEMRLDRVHGYRGYDCRNNILAGNDGLILWFVGRLVVLSAANGTQRFYLEHLDDVACIAKVETPHAAAGSEEEEEEEEHAIIVATAQVGDLGVVHVWDSASLTSKARLTHGFAIRQLAFSPRDVAMLVSAGGHEPARSRGQVGVGTFTVWNWSEECQLVRLTTQLNVPFLELKCNPAFEPQGGEDDQIWAVTCGPTGVVFWALTEPKEVGGKYNLTTEEGGLHHVSDHASDPMAICAHFVSARILVTGMADGDIVTWRGVHSTNRIRLAHPGGVYDMGGNTSTIVSGGKDCTLRVWDVNAFKGSSVPTARHIVCKGLLQDRVACIRSVCCGTGARQNKIYGTITPPTQTHIHKHTTYTHTRTYKHTHIHTQTHPHTHTL